MRICFLADAGSINTRTWVDYVSDRLGHEVHVVSVCRGGELGPSVTLHQIGGHRRGMRGASKLAYLLNEPRVRRIVRSLAPDIVVGYRVASYGYLAARTGVRPCVVVAQSQDVVAPDAPAATRHFARRAIAGADLAHAWARHSADRLVELGANPADVFVCPRGIDLGRFRPGDGCDRAPSVIATRGLHDAYRVDRIVRGVALAAAELPGITATILGDGEAREGLERLARELGAGDRIRFAGAVGHDELPSLLQRHPMYASAVPTDGVSASLLEAMACGSFPIVVDNAANRDWITDRSTGRLLGEAGAEEFARAIVESWRDEELRRRARAENLAVVQERADLDTNMRRIDERYRRLIEEAGPSRRRSPASAGRRSRRNARRADACRS